MNTTSHTKFLLALRGSRSHDTHAKPTTATLPGRNIGLKYSTDIRRVNMPGLPAVGVGAGYNFQIVKPVHIEL